ncbi:MAG: PEP/pyruvate-binding domain-containing protein, partial [Sulfolobales archaeon]
MSFKKYVYSFNEGDWRDKKLLGGKGSSLAQMTQIGLPVPPGFTITTEACREFYASKRDEIDALVKELEKNGIKIIQIDEPAFREKAPIKRRDWPSYFEWSIKAF